MEETEKKARTSGMETRDVPAGRFIFREGEVGDLAFIVTEGVVEISREVNGKKVLLGKVPKGGLFGEMALLNDEPRMASAFAYDNVKLLVISRVQMAKKMVDLDPFHRALIDVLSNHVRSVADKLGDAGIPAS
ncbi:MAG: cyclic nucleotide-binding domain-containing protein [Rhodospirillales bacterium]|jgi:CRP-like cAMP-binding protein